MRRRIRVRRIPYEIAAAYALIALDLVGLVLASIGRHYLIIIIPILYIGWLGKTAWDLHLRYQRVIRRWWRMRRDREPSRQRGFPIEPVGHGSHTHSN